MSENVKVITLRHKVTREEFERPKGWNEVENYVSAFDKNGELRQFRREVLEEVAPVEEWEPVPFATIAAMQHGELIVDTRTGTITYPDPSLRFIKANGSLVLQRRKA